jgi:hypothetical protein
VLSVIIRRVSDDEGAVPLVVAYDYHERVWNPPSALLSQRRYVGENRPIGGPPLRELIAEALAGSGLSDASGRSLHFTPHDFRRIFVTDAILHGMAPHIAQLVVGHRDITTTMGYKAVYPEEALSDRRTLDYVRPPSLDISRYVLLRGPGPCATHDHLFCCTARPTATSPPLLTVMQRPSAGQETATASRAGPRSLGGAQLVPSQVVALLPATAPQYALVVHETVVCVAPRTGSAACSDQRAPSQTKALPPMLRAMQYASPLQETASRLTPSWTRRDHREPSQVTAWPHTSTTAQDRAVEQESE